jgi:SAM-dependent methyltransferase
MDRKDVAPARGLDGLTSVELSASRRGWWDEAFTELLVRRVPTGATKLLDVGCGVASAAHALLPKLNGAIYIGIDADEKRLQEAEKILVGLAYANRVELRSGRAEQLPCPDAEADFALSTMTMQHLPEPNLAVREVFRALAPGGVFVAVEPDNVNNLLYFDEGLEDVTAALRGLFSEQRLHRRPADIALGPTVARIVEQEGLSVLEFFPYALGRAKKLAAEEFFRRAKQGVDIVAATLPPRSPAVEACMSALARAESDIGRTTVGYGCQFVPVFVCVAQKTHQ